MIGALAKWILERGVFRRAACLPTAERSQFLDRTAFVFALLTGFSLLNAFCAATLCFYIGYVWLSSPSMPEILSLSRIILYLLVFALLTLLFVFLAALGFAGRRLLTA